MQHQGVRGNHAIKLQVGPYFYTPAGWCEALEVRSGSVSLVFRPGWALSFGWYDTEQQRLLMSRVPECGLHPSRVRILSTLRDMIEGRAIGTAASMMAP